jgi:hypothetical protein
MSPTLEHARSHLADLHEELAAARAAGLVDHPAYRADLAQELATAQAAYVLAAVTEIASLRAQLGGPQQG